MPVSEMIVDKLSDFPIIEVSIQNKDIYIHQAHILSSNIPALAPGTIYLSKLSSFYKLNIAEDSSIFFLIQEDTDLSNVIYPSNYVLFDSSTDINELFNYVQSLLKSFLRITKAHVSISQALYTGVDIPDLLKIAADLIGNPIILQDSSTKLLANSDITDMDISDDEILTNLFKNGFVTSDLFKKYDYTNVLNTIKNRQEAFVLKSSYKKDRIIRRLIVNQQYFGWVLTVCINKPFQKEDCKILDILSSALTIALEKNIKVFAANSCENLLLELLSGHPYTEKQFKSRAAGFGWHLKDCYYMMIIADRKQADTPKESFVKTMMAYKNHLSLLFPTMKILFYEEKLILLFDAPNLFLVEGILLNFLQNADLVGALSNHFTNILEFKDHHEQTLNILNIGLNLKRPDIIFYYKDMYPYHVMSVLKGIDNMKYYCLPQLLKVVQYDRTYNTNYVSSIREYLKTRNIALSAKRLDIHRNTMLYRMEKFEELSGLDLRKGTDIYKLWLSYIVLDLCPELALSLSIES